VGEAPALGESDVVSDINRRQESKTVIHAVLPVLLKGVKSSLYPSAAKSETLVSAERFTAE
jgi:hypothetical protein